MPLRAISAAELTRSFPGSDRHALAPPIKRHIKQKRAPETGASPAKAKSRWGLRR
jgi:hypothetical protein